MKERRPSISRKQQDGNPTLPQRPSSGLDAALKEQERGAASADGVHGHGASAQLTPRAKRAFPSVVGIGASAGGLVAFTQLLRNIAPDNGFAYVLVQHLDPTHESLLAELLSKAAPVPVMEVRDGLRIEANHAYVIPPNATMTIQDGHLRLAARNKHRGPHSPIDDFLRSLADVQGSQAIGIILSGAGSDGARGLEAIKAQGGITMAQDAASTLYPSMPESAAETGHVDFVLRPEEIALQLNKIAHHVTASRAEIEAPETPSTDDTDQLHKILHLLQKRSAVDFRQYRRGTIERRVLRRMLLHRQDSHEEYLAHLRAHPGELDDLYEDLLIGVTSFFRDPEVFAALQSTGFPAMMKNRPRAAPIRVWVAGCAGGEETYSVAMALLESLGDRFTQTPVQIFATDLSESALAKARAGLYPSSIATAVSPERLEQFFVQDENGYRIAKFVRDLCVFSRQNILRDPPFSHLDLISCRNVLIYLDSAMQRRVFPIFHYALNPNGVLLLGNAESVGTASDFFSPLDKQHRLYRRRGTRTPPLDLELAAPAADDPRPRKSQRTAAFPSPANEMVSDIDRALLARFAPAGIVINEQLEILQFRGDTAEFLHHAPGMASLSLPKLARQELLRPLRRAIQQASADGRAVREENIKLRDENGSRLAAIEVLPIRRTASRGRLFVVTFEARSAASKASPPAPSTGRKGVVSRRKKNDLRALRDELAEARQHIQDLAEAYEATNEELRASNEEVQSSNEELQSTNEELETTKEEIQSANEELTTVNDELRHRNRELSALSSDLTNVLANTQVPIIIVGGDLRLRRFTPAAERVMRVIATDVGRLFSDLKLRVDVHDVERRITSAMQTLEASELDVRDNDGRWWSMCVRPYQTVDRRVDGAVLVFTDIDDSKRFGERAQETAESRRQLLLLAEAARNEADAARENAQAANQAKSLFLAGMSHDLRTPLNAIMGFLQLVEMELRGPVTEEQHADFARIRRSALHLLSLINDVLNFAKLESGKVEFHLAELALVDVIDELEGLVRSQLESKSIGYERHECDSRVLADPDKLLQILLNLVTNAIKFTKAGGRVSIHCVAAGDVTRIEISDTGVGIPLDQLERIFEPFVQVNRSLTSTENEGVGLGLAISRDLARRMGGDLTVESMLGLGSRFSLSLPRVAQ